MIRVCLIALLLLTGCPEKEKRATDDAITERTEGDNTERTKAEDN